jgi:hypothetical protein
MIRGCRGCGLSPGRVWPLTQVLRLIANNQRLAVELTVHTGQKHSIVLYFLPAKEGTLDHSKTSALAARLPVLLDMIASKPIFTIVEAQVLTGLSKASLYDGRLKIRNGLVRRESLEQLLDQLFQGGSQGAEANKDD